MGINPEYNRARFYRLPVQPTLWGEIALVQTWGRLGTAGRVRVTIYSARTDAHAAVVQIIRHRLRHGHEVVAWRSRYGTLLHAAVPDRRAVVL